MFSAPILHEQRRQAGGSRNHRAVKFAVTVGDGRVKDGDAVAGANKVGER